MASKKRRVEEEVQKICDRFEVDKKLLEIIYGHANSGTSVFSRDKEWFGTYGDWHDNYWLIVLWLKTFFISGFLDSDIFTSAFDLMESDYPEWDSRTEMFQSVVEQIQESVSLGRGFVFDIETPFDKETEDGKFILSNLDRYKELIYMMYDEGMHNAYCAFMDKDTFAFHKYSELKQPWKTDKFPVSDENEVIAISHQNAKKETKLLKRVRRYRSLINILVENRIDDDDNYKHPESALVVKWISERKKKSSETGLVANE